MRVLVACEFSGVVRDAFRALGHDAWSCDIIPTERPGPHIVNDVRNVLDWDWDLMIAHPDCTHLARSGSRWWYRKQVEQREAIRFVDLLWNAPVPRIAIENPRGVLSYRKPSGGRVWRAYDQLIQPWQFGEPESKETCLWLKGLPPLMYSLICVERFGRVHHEGPGRQRKANRARTMPGIAAAMAAQWGGNRLQSASFAHCEDCHAETFTGRQNETGQRVSDVNGRSSQHDTLLGANGATQSGRGTRNDCRQGVVLDGERRATSQEHHKDGTPQKDYLTSLSRGDKLLSVNIEVAPRVSAPGQRDTGLLGVTHV